TASSSNEWRQSSRRTPSSQRAAAAHRCPRSRRRAPQACCPLPSLVVGRARGMSIPRSRYPLHLGDDPSFEGFLMRVHVISDMEGVGGIVKYDQTTAGKPMYEEGRKLYTQEINAAVRGAKTAGATEIVVMDCHGAGEGYSFNSLIPEDLDPACEYVVQEEWTGYTEFLEQG